VDESDRLVEGHRDSRTTVNIEAMSIHACVRMRP
jgi:hypothetical protein